MRQGRPEYIMTVRLHPAPHLARVESGLDLDQWKGEVFIMNFSNILFAASLADPHAHDWRCIVPALVSLT